MDGKKARVVFTMAACGLGLLLFVTGIRAERLPVKTYTTADGLPADKVFHIMRDSRGFLWFCTRDGLSKFDGYQFHNYGTTHGVPNPWVNDLIEASPTDRGAAVVHIFRFQGDRVVELWDIGQPVPENSLNENGMF